MRPIQPRATHLRATHLRATHWWTCVRRSYAPYFLPLAAGMLFVDYVAQGDTESRFEWQWSSVNAGRYLLFGGAIMAGSCAWEAWLTRRRLDAYLASVPSSGLVPIGVWVGAAAWWLSLHLLSVLGHLALAASSGAVGSPSWGSIAGQFLAVAGFCALGVLIGWWVRSPIAAPALAVVLLLGVFLDGYGGLRPSRLVSFGSVRSLVGLHFVPTLMWLKAGFFLGVVVALAGLLIRQRRTRVGVVVVAMVGAGLAGVNVVTWTGADLIPASSSENVCAPRHVGVQVCGVAELQTWFPSMTTELAGLEARLRSLGVTQLPTEFRVYGENGDRQSPGVGIVYADLARARDEALRKPMLIEAIAVPRGCEDILSPPSEKVIFFRATVFGWLLRRLGADVPGAYPADVVEHISTLDERTQRTWFAHTYSQLWRCQSDGLGWPAGVTGPSAR